MRRVGATRKQRPRGRHDARNRHRESCRVGAGTADLDFASFKGRRGNHRERQSAYLDWRAERARQWLRDWTFPGRPECLEPQYKHEDEQ